MSNTLCTIVSETVLFQLCRDSFRAPFTQLLVLFFNFFFCFFIHFFFFFFKQQKQTLGFKKGKHPKFSEIIYHLVKKCWEASQQVKTPLRNMSSCLLYYSLYFFFVFLCICAITPVLFLFLVMYTSIVECRTVFEPMPEICHHTLSLSHVLLSVCVLVLFICYQLCTISIVMLNRKQVHWVLHWICFFSERKECRPSCLQHGHTVYCQTCRTVPNSPLERLVLHLILGATVLLKTLFIFPPLSLLHHLLKHRRTARLCPLAVFLRV